MAVISGASTPGNLAGLFSSTSVVPISILPCFPRCRSANFALDPPVAQGGSDRIARIVCALENVQIKMLRRNAKALEWVIAGSVGSKAEVVSADEREGGGAFLNLGRHHRPCARSGHRNCHFLHGEAVAWGMIAGATHIAAGWTGSLGTAPGGFLMPCSPWSAPSREYPKAKAFCAGCRADRNAIWFGNICVAAKDWES